MNHALCQEKMVDLIYGELPAGEASEVRGHIDGCQDCRFAFEALSGTRRLMQMLREEKPPAAGEAKLVEAARRAAEAAPGRRRLLSSGAWKVSLLAASLLVVGGVSLKLLDLRRAEDSLTALDQTLPAEAAEAAAASPPVATPVLPPPRRFAEPPPPEVAPAEPLAPTRESRPAKKRAAELKKPAARPEAKERSRFPGPVAAVAPPPEPTVRAFERAEGSGAASNQMKGKAVAKEVESAPSSDEADSAAAWSPPPSSAGPVPAAEPMMEEESAPTRAPSAPPAPAPRRERASQSPRGAAAPSTAPSEAPERASEAMGVTEPLPSSPGTLLRMAQERERVGDWMGAERLYRRLMERFPRAQEWPAAAAARARLLRRLGRHQEAEAVEREMDER
jgi:hypothetical protein